LNILTEHRVSSVVILFLHFLPPLDVDVDKLLLARIKSLHESLEKFFADDALYLDQTEYATLTNISVLMIDDFSE
jgi:hypothetical protein